MVQQGWAHDLVGSRDTIRMRMPRIHAVADTDTALERDPHARTARLPKIAFEAVRRALDADKPVLIQVPRKDTYQSWPAGTALPLHDAGTAMALWACPPQAAPTKPPYQPAAGADAPTPDTAATNAAPPNSAPSSSEPTEPPKNSDAPSRKCLSNSPGATKYSTP